MLSSLFKREKSIADCEALSDFLGAETAFLVQKTIWEYSRARAGVLWQKLFKEDMFKQAIQASTWQNYALGLAFVSEMVASILREKTRLTQDNLDDFLSLAIARSLAAQNPPAFLQAHFVAETSAFVMERLRTSLALPPKEIKDIPLNGHQAFFARLPMHPSLTKHDVLLLRNTLRILLCRAAEKFLSRLDIPAIEAIASRTQAEKP